MSISRRILIATAALLVAGAALWRVTHRTRAEGAALQGNKAWNPQAAVRSPDGKRPVLRSIPSDPEARKLFETYVSFLRKGTSPDDAFMENMAGWDINAGQYREVILALLDCEEGSFESRMNFVGDLLLMMTNRHALESLALLDVMASRLNKDGRVPYQVTMVIDQATQKDPQFAADWLKEHASRMDEKLLRDSTLILLSRAASANPALAFSIAAGLPPEQRKEAMLAISRGADSRESREEIWQKVQQMSSTLDPEAAAELRKTAIEGIANGLGGEHQTPGGCFSTEASFADAMHWIDSAHLEPQDITLIAAHLQTGWRSTENGLWLDWISRNVEDDVQRTASLAKIIGTWSSADPRGAEEWLFAHKETPDSATTARAFITGIRTSDPAAVARVAELIPEDRRAAVLQEISDAADADAANRELRVEKMPKVMEKGMTREEEAMKAARAAREQQGRRN